MRIAIFANGILENAVGGAQKNMNEVIIGLSKYYDLTYFPEMQAYKIKNDVEYNNANKLKGYGIKIAEPFFEDNMEQKTIIDHYTGQIKECDFIYNLDLQYYLENRSVQGDLSIMLANITKKPVGICLQDLGDTSAKFHDMLYNAFKISRMIPQFFGFIFTASIYGYINRKLTVGNLLKCNELLFVSAVNNKIECNVNLKNKTIFYLDPSNAIDSKIIKYKNIKKENKIIFFARLIYMKGIFDLIYIMRRILDKIDTKIVIAGEFKRINEKNLFMKMVKKFKLGDHIIYKGFLSDNDLYKEIGSSRLMIYPSHSDSFSLSVLESISVNVPVVAYDIPGLSLYKEFKCVKLVKEFSIKSMAEQAIQMYSHDDSIFDDIKLTKFIELHASWENVVMSHKKIIDKYFGKNRL